MLVIFILLCAMWIPAFINIHSLPVVAPNDHMPLYALFNKFTGTRETASTIISFIMVVIILGIIIYFNTKDFFINQRTLLPALFYVLLNSIIPSNQTLNPVLPAVIFLMIAIIRIMDSYKKQGIANNFFDAGVLIGIGTLFYADLIWFGLLLFIGIFLLRTVTIKEILISVTGLATPFLIAISLFFLGGEDISGFFAIVKSNLFTKAEIPNDSLSPSSIIALVFCGIIILISVIDLAGKIDMKKNRTRNTFYLFLWVLIISVLLFFLLKTVSYEIIWIATVPLSFFLGHFFIYTKRKVLPDILIYGMMFAAILVQLFRFIT
jgi:hypothetical protein